MRVWPILLIGMLGGCSTIGPQTTTITSAQWQLVFWHDQRGAPIEGSKQALLDAVRGGQPVRVYWSGRRVEHVADGLFLTILGGEVFAQVPTIRGQAPSVDPPAIVFRDNQWQGIFATNGERELKWFVPQ